MCRHKAPLLGCWNDFLKIEVQALERNLVLGAQSAESLQTGAVERLGHYDQVDAPFTYVASERFVRTDHGVALHACTRHGRIVGDKTNHPVTTGTLREHVAHNTGGDISDAVNENPGAALAASMGELADQTERRA